MLDRSFSRILLLAFVATAVAQQSPTTRVIVRVSDPTGALVAHSHIRVIPAPDPTPAKMETDDKGQLALSIAPGGHALFVSTPGFKNVTMHIEVTASSEVQIIPVTLQLAPTGSPIVLPDSYKDALQLSAFPYHETVWLKLAEFKSLAHVTVTVHNPHANADEIYSGVTVASLFANLGAPLGKELRGPAMTSFLVATGGDGYQVVLSLAEVDPAFHPGDVIVADSMNGHPLDASSGPFKLVVSEDKRPARWVRNLASLELKSLE